MSSQPRQAPPGRRIAWLRRTAGLLAAVLCLTLAPAAPANANVNIDEQQFRNHVFAAYMRVHAPGLQGLKDMVLSVAAADWRRANPAATTADIARHMARVKSAIDATYVADIYGAGLYNGMIKFIEAASGVPGVSIATPGLKVLLESTIGENLAQTAAIENQVTGAFQTNMFLTHYYQTQRWAWEDVTRLGQQDADFTAAWNGMVGGRAGVTLDATVDNLLADPLIATYFDVEAILQNQSSQTAYLLEIREQVQAAFAALSAKNDQIVAQLAAASLRYPVGPGPKPTPEAYTQALRQAAERQVELDALGSGLFILSTLAGFVDPALGNHISTLGKAGLAIATAVNNYLPTVAGLTVGQALSSLSTMTLTGNILGAVMSILPMFASGPTPEQMIMDQIRELRLDVSNLRVEMNARFDAIERALTIVYSDLMTQFAKLSGDISVIRGQLSDIQQTLLRIDSKVDTLALFTARALQNSALAPLRTDVNGYLNYQQRTGQPIPDYSTYAQVENTFHLASWQTSRQEPFASTEINNTGVENAANVLNTYGPGGSVSYLTWLAQNRYGAAVPTPAKTVPSAGVFQLGARAYAALQLQNPAYAQRIASYRSTEIRNTGNDYLTATRWLSAPNSDGTTNNVFTGIVNEYRRDVNAVSAELLKVRNRISGGAYSPFGGADQAPPTRIAGPPGMPVCGKPGTSVISAAGNTTYTTLPNVYQTAALAMPSDNKPAFSSCWTAAWADIDGDPTENTWGSVRIQVKNQIQWPGQPAQDIRTVTHQSYFGTICTYNVKYETQTCKNAVDQVRANWSSKYKALVEQSSSVFLNPPPFDDTHRRTTAALQGKALQYFQTVSAEIRGDTELGRANRTLTRTLSLIQAYTEVAFPKALEGNAILNSLLYGNQRLLGDYAPLPGIPGDSGLTNAFERAKDNYSGCEQSGTGLPCKIGYSPNVKAGQAAPYDNDCPVADAVGDHVANCLAGYLTPRSDLLAAQYARHSRELFDRVYTEGSPQIEALVTELGTVDRMLHTVTPLSLGRPVTSSSNEQATGNVARYAVDGDTTTRWSSAYTDQEWLQVDLGSARAINRVVLNWEVACGRAFQIQTSQDGATWTTIYSTTTGNGGVQDLSVSGNGRYVRMNGTLRATQWGFSLWEFQVYGT